MGDTILYIWGGWGGRSTEGTEVVRGFGSGQSAGQSVCQSAGQSVVRCVCQCVCQWACHLIPTGLARKHPIGLWPPVNPYSIR